MIREPPSGARLGALLLALAFLASAAHVFHTRAESEPAGRVTLRLGHWLLHSGMREAFEEAALEYGRLHPGVHIEVIAVPIKVWPVWQRVQIAGDNAPDILGLLNANEEMLLRHFTPITDELAAPNPYNAGTPLEGVPWRDTFAGGMEVWPVYSASADEVFGVYLQLNTLRLFYNADLLREVTGGVRPPRTLDELVALDRAVRERRARAGGGVVTIASCAPYSETLFQRVAQQMTQRLVLRASPQRTLSLSEQELARLVLEGRVPFGGDEFRAAFLLMKTLGDMMQPGFQQLAREDALHTFLSGKAVAVFTGSWDYNGLVTNASFPVAVAQLPLPTPGDRVFGAGVLGPFSESALSPEAHFGITRRSPHRALAVDFLRYLSSRPVAARFSRSTLRMASLVGMEPPPELRDVAPVLDGSLPGVGTTFRDVGAGHTRKLFQINFHRLFGDGTVEDFARVVEAEAPATLRLDLERSSHGIRRETATHDARIGLLLGRAGPGDLDAALRLLETQHAREWEAWELLEASREPVDEPGSGAPR